MGPCSSLLRLAVVVAMMAAACDKSPSEPPIPAAIRVTPETAVLNYIGASLQLNAAVLDRANQPITGAVVSWTSSNTAIVTVDQTGKVTATGVGTAQIAVRADTARFEVPITVRQVLAQLAIVAQPDTIDGIGGQSILTGQAFDSAGNQMQVSQITWSSADTSIISVAANGIATSRALGSTEITASVGEVTTKRRIVVHKFPAMRIEYRFVGGGLDANGVVIKFDDKQFPTTTAAGSVTYPRLAVGLHDVSVTDLASHCIAIPNQIKVNAVPQTTTVVNVTIRCAGDFAFEQWDGVLGYHLKYMSPSAAVTTVVGDGYERFSGAWSHDGKRLAYARTIDGNTDIYVLDWTTGISQRITSDPDKETNPAWLPDNQSLAFTAMHGTRGVVYRMKADGSSRTPITSVDPWVGFPLGPYSSPGTDWISIGLFLADGLTLINTRTGAIRTIPNSRVISAFSRDGNWVAFDSWLFGSNPELHVMKTDGTERRRVASVQVVSTTPAWAPDSRRLIFTGVEWQPNGDFRFRLYRTSLDGDVAMLTPERFTAMDPAWPEEDVVFFSGDVGAMVGIYAMSPDGSNKQLVYHNPNLAESRPLPRPR